MLFGYSDPTEDIALVHFVYWGRHLPRISEETAKRVLDLAPLFEIRLHDLGGIDSSSSISVAGNGR